MAGVKQMFLLIVFHVLLLYNGANQGKLKRTWWRFQGGSWREESELAYIPTYVDDGSRVQCTVTYPNGQRTERSRTLDINYSPKNVTITITGNKNVMEGSDVTLQCNSFSKPDVHEYEWYKGKTRLPDRGREMTVYNVTRDMEPYSCTAINPVGRGESALAEIPVLYAPTGVRVIVKNEGELICDFRSSRPDVTHYTWMKDGSILYETGKTLTLEDNEESSGQYSCVAHNRVGSSTSEEQHIQWNKVNLPLILGTVAGVFFLLLFILIIYFSLRYFRKLHSPTSKTTTAGNLSNNLTVIDEANQNGNIYSNCNPEPEPTRSISSVYMKFTDNSVIYSNSEATQDVEYSYIAHVPHDQSNSRVSHGQDVEYATLRY
ncbi:B-cell receptor CD22-like [Leptodactylus fuscus]